MKIHCEEIRKPGFDDIPLEEVKQMIGWVEPPVDSVDKSTKLNFHHTGFS